MGQAATTSCADYDSGMTRLEGVRRPGLIARLGYWIARRKVGRVPDHLPILAHHPRLLRAYGHMEMGQEASRTVEPALKLLAQIRIAMRIGCPF